MRATVDLDPSQIKAPVARFVYPVPEPETQMPTSLLQSLQSEANDLVAERDAAIAAAETRAANGGTRGFTDDERTRLIDNEHLRLLTVGFYIAAAANAI